jgi:hypothetical protein
MKIFVTVLSIIAVAHLALVGLSIGEGLLLHWMIPSLDFPIAVLMGLLATTATVFLGLQFLKVGLEVYTLRESNDDDGIEADEEIRADEEDQVPPRRFREVNVSLPPLSPRRRRKRR